MRRLRSAWCAARADRERGAVSIMVAFLMVLLLGFAAIAVDVGVLYAERAQLQNGADAAALAMAQKCARDLNGPLCTESSGVAIDYANKNSLDNLSNVQSVGLDKAAGKVTVKTGAQEPGGEANTVSLFFANALGVPTAEVGAVSSAIWGSPTAGRTPFPLTFSICQVEGWVEGATQTLQSHGSGANPSCNYGPSGQTVSGGFGWLLQDPGKCGGSVDIHLAEGGSETGNDGPSNCDATMNSWANEINAGRDVTVLLPIFNKVTGTGSSASYNLTSFAAFKIVGWKFSGGSSLPMVFHNTETYTGTGNACVGDCRGIIGKFVKYVSLEDGYTLGPLDAHGSAVVRMAG